MSARKTQAVRYRIRCCAFCGLTEYQVSVLIEGPAIGFVSNVNICRDCVDICSDIIAKHDKRSEPPPAVVGCEDAATHDHSDALPSAAQKSSLPSEDPTSMAPAAQETQEDGASARSGRHLGAPHS